MHTVVGTICIHLDERPALVPHLEATTTSVYTVALAWPPPFTSAALAGSYPPPPPPMCSSTAIPRENLVPHQTFPSDISCRNCRHLQLPASFGILIVEDSIRNAHLRPQVFGASSFTYTYITRPQRSSRVFDGLIELVSYLFERHDVG